MEKDLKNIMKICNKYENESMKEIKKICEKQIFANKLNEYSFKVDASDIYSTEWVNIRNWCGNMSIGIWGVDYNRTICNVKEQPKNEMLFSISFPTGAYIFGDDYPKELFQRFYKELEQFNPKFNDETNHHMLFDLENGSKLYESYEEIYKRYEEEHIKSAKIMKIKELQVELARLESLE